MAALTVLVRALLHRTKPRHGHDRRIALAQSAYYLLTGVWPLVSLKTFEAVTGPKTDRWLVQTVGLLAASTGAGLAYGAHRGRVAPETRTIAVLSALSFAAIDVYYVYRRRIAPVYLLDAVAEAALAAAWLRTSARGDER
jgi:hypothetical protein